jgi:endonuclease/exonuclease/phosphatase (EEP) superfamily protein YafD
MSSRRDNRLVWALIVTSLVAAVALTASTMARGRSPNAARSAGADGPAGSPTTEPTSRPATQPTSQPAPAFTVAAYNINYGNADLKAVAKLVGELDADLVCIVESNAESERHLRRALAKAYPHMTFIRRPAAGGFGFLSRKPLTGVRYHKPKAGWFGFYECTVKFGEQSVQVVGVHLQPVVPTNGEGVGGLAKLLVASEKVRAEQGRHLLEILSTDRPVVALGDYNCQTFMAACRSLADKGYIDSFAAVNEEPDKQISWHWKYKGIEYRFRIDHIFHSPHWRTLSSRIEPQGPSDHYPIVSRLELLPAGQGREAESQPAVVASDAQANDAARRRSE